MAEEAVNALGDGDSCEVDDDEGFDDNATAREGITMMLNNKFAEALALFQKYKYAI